MAYYRVRGGKKLQGSITTTSGKNSPVALICAALLIRGTVRLKDIARVDEVDRLLKLIESIGVQVVWEDQHTLCIDASADLTLDTIDKEACKKMRISLLLMGALAAREKTYKIYKSGGCKLGERTIKPHTLALEKIGIQVISTPGYYEVINHPLKAADIVMYEAGDTATENVIIAAVLAPGKTTIRFASANYMVQDLCYFLNEAGAKIEGIGTTSLTITGVKSLKPVKEYYPMPDPVDAMAWIALAATTKSELLVKNCPRDFLSLELEKLSVMGLKYEIKRKYKSKNGHFDVMDVLLFPSTFTALPDKLTCQPYPGLNIDALPLFVPILTQAKGQTLVLDWVYENRALYTLELQKLGAQVLLMDPHRALIQGPTKLIGNEVVCPPAIRPGMSILIAMIAAKGTSVLRNVGPIERAYENLIPRLQAVGVDIERVEE